ncbi:NepR family anti-sigma factor [Sandaracinobacteroides hominis]|uniref:NepR family anti-sigma factor n=1 Tax=Sandaracinobacteroides hominis TaxID=2780086 RepID=UPI0018F3E7D2|nr:NepR family anti-sigma factor [Sandaracinobacteroides hominis]
MDNHKRPEPSGPELKAADVPRGRTAPGKADPIADGLRRLWADAEAEPIPDDFLDILDRVDAARATPTNSQSEGQA